MKTVCFCQMDSPVKRILIKNEWVGPKNTLHPRWKNYCGRNFKVASTQSPLLWKGISMHRKQFFSWRFSLRQSYFVWTYLLIVLIVLFTLITVGTRVSSRTQTAITFDSKTALTSAIILTVVYNAGALQPKE